MSAGDQKLRKSWPVNSIVGCLLRRPYAFGAAIWPPPPDWTVSVCTASVVSSNAGCLSVHASRPTGTERVGCTYHTNISLKKWWLFICNILGLFFFINFSFGWKCTYMSTALYARKILNEEHFFINNEKGFWSYILIML